jgi:DNA polymerase III subunit alpha, Gram-positive type
MDVHTKIRDVVFCALDIETTGINPVVDRMLEIGIIRFSMSGIIEQFESFVNPERDIPAENMLIHGITEEMVKDAPVVGDLLGKITEFIGDSPLVIQNPRFDLAFLDIAFKLRNLNIPFLEAYDTVSLSKKTFPGMTDHRLQTLCKRLNIEIHHHRALSDAYGCMELFKKILGYHDSKGNWTIKDLNRLHGQTIIPQLTTKQKEKLNFNNKIFIGDTVKIRYMDDEGRISIRKIFPKSLIKNGKKSYIHAYCYLREDDRYFNIARILKVF